MKKNNLIKVNGKLGVLLPGLGAVSSTFIAGVCLIRKGLARPFGSLTQMQTIRLGKRSDNKSPFIKDVVPIANLKDLEFAAWDVFPDDAYESAVIAGVLPREMLDKVKNELKKIKPYKAVFEKKFVKKLDGPHLKTYKNKMEAAEKLIDDIKDFKKKNKIDRCVMVWCGSTEIYQETKVVHKNLKDFEKGLRENNKYISPSMIYAYAALREKIPYCNGAPNLSVDIPALVELADKTKTPIGGKDFKTGQTMMKTLLSPGLKAKMLGVNGWFSTNILGNRDGEILDDPESFKTKEKSKLSVLDTIFQPDMYPELYKDLYHKVRINYYPPRGDSKESWDNIDIFGWLGMPMQIKVNFLCRDSILAAPVVLDLVLFIDLASRLGLTGIQHWLSFYWKSPMTPKGISPEHDLFIQHMKLKNTLRILIGEEPIDHSIESD
ncbi:inositol-3-phosphate synthase [Candidatus Dependentiae bacterium]|nr:inositol-3-phosphate synthase [Candidatus Dependentiae bacterium]